MSVYAGRQVRDLRLEGQISNLFAAPEPRENRDLTPSVGSVGLAGARPVRESAE